MAAAADRLGHRDGFFHPNLAVTFDDRGPGQTNRFGVPQRGCTFCGQCDIGCNVGAKNTLDLNYLALAERAGATVGTRTEALWVGVTGDGGYRVRLREHGRPGAGREGVEREVTARYVFICAGAIGTTELLLRSRDQYGTLPGLSAALGTRYSGNGDFLSFGRNLDTDFAPAVGPTITTALGETRAFGAHLDARRTAVLLAMGRDRAEGRIELRGPKHRLRVVWDTTRNDPLYADEQALAGQVVRAFGGTPFATPMWRLFRQPVTVHNLGGVPMGDGPDTGAASPDGEVFGHPGLYVLDGALLPGATGGNPSLTITAVAERCARSAVRRITGDASWRAPEHAGATRGAVPEDAAVQSVRLIGPRRPVPPGVRFAEAMAGTVGLPAEAGPATPARRYDATVPTGRVRVGVADTLRMLSSVRATGAPPGRSGAGTVLRFSAFFAGQVARAYLGRR